MRCPAAAGRYTEEILMGKFITVLYDLDGTLWESGPGITKAVQTALRACGIDEPDPDNLTSFIGPPLNVEFKRRYHFDDEETAKAIAVFRSYYDEKGIYENRLYPGVKKMLKDLKEAGICIGAASSKPQPLVDRLMDYFEIRQYFDVLVGSDPQDELKNRSGSDSKSAIVATALAKAGCSQWLCSRRCRLWVCEGRRACRRRSSFHGKGCAGAGDFSSQLKKSEEAPRC